MPVYQKTLPHFPWADPKLARLPGVQPMVEIGDFLRRDEAFAGQMALRDDLIAHQLEDVHAVLPQALLAAQELYDIVLQRLSQDESYEIGPAQITRPDGVVVKLDRSKPLITLGRLVQEDLCILQPQDGEHHLTGAILCFPASWTLAEKLGRAMLAIHHPVESYSVDIATRVQRMLDVMRPTQGLWRMNYLTYAVPDLHHPLREATPRDRSVNIPKPYARCERQCFIKLPQTGAVVFTIHTYLMPIVYLPPEVRAGLEQVTQRLDRA
ncbi:MAG: DUF3445 domain-containing protein [Cypionkella sp.]|nr:DUF3445 domain-containing protein [Cypionkella sp.]